MNSTAFLKWLRTEFLVRLRLEPADGFVIRWSSGATEPVAPRGQLKLELSFAAQSSAAPTEELWQTTARGRFITRYVSVERGADAVSRVRVAVDVPAILGWFLSRVEEYETTALDVHQRFPYEASMRSRCGLPACPVPDLMIEQLAEFVGQEAARLGLVLRRRSLWPDGKRYACILTYDVDNVGAPWFWWFVRRFGGGARQLLRRRVRWGLNQWSELPAALLIGLGLKSPMMALEGLRNLTEAQGFRATFFLMSLAGWRAEEGAANALHYPADLPGLGQLLRSYNERGHEIGLHGSYNAAVSATMLQEERARLEQAIGGPVKGHRHHFLRTRVPESLQAYEAAGFDYDMSLGWGTNHATVRPGTLLPFVPYDLVADRPLKLHELGIHLMDHGDLSFKRHLKNFEKLRTAARQGAGVMVVLYHPSILRVFRSKVAAAAFREILRRLKADPEVWVAPAGEVLAQWKKSVAGLDGAVN